MGSFQMGNNLNLNYYIDDKKIVIKIFMKHKLIKLFLNFF